MRHEWGEREWEWEEMEYREGANEAVAADREYDHLQVINNREDSHSPALPQHQAKRRRNL